MLERIIFAIDNDRNPHQVAKFMRHMDALVAMDKAMPFVQTIGCYKGQLENSYMIYAKDLHHVQNYIENQECILRVPGDVRQPCVLEYPDGSSESIGPMREVSAVEALQADAWTYVPGSGKYFVCSS